MIKVSLAVISAVSFIGLTEAFRFRDDKCGDAEVWFDGYYGRVQCDYNDYASGHYRYEDGHHAIWAFTDDEPHMNGAKGKNPRTEITLRDKHSYSNRDVAEFSGQVYIPPTTNIPFSFFQIKHDGEQGSTATSAMLNHQDGALRYYTGGHVFVGSMKGRWINFKVVHNGPQKDIHIYINGQHFKDNADGSVNSFHFKFGVYGKQDQNNQHEKFEARFKDISVKINGNQAM